MRIALVGYYDTGNLGDDIQGQVAARALEGAGHSVKWFSIGLIRDGWADFLDDQNMEQVNDYDAVVFGGGLLFQEYVPEFWYQVRRITKPLCLLNVGLEYEVRPPHPAQVEFANRAIHLSFRRQGYIGMPDAILGADLAFVLYGNTQDNGDVLAICVNSSKPTIEAIRPLVERFRKVRFVVMDNHPGRRSGMDACKEVSDALCGIEAIVPQTMTEATEALAEVGAVITSRRHPAIIAALCGIRPVMLADHPRLFDVHCSFWGCKWSPALETVADRISYAMEHPVTHAEIQPLRKRAQAAINDCLAKLGEIQ